MSYFSELESGLFIRFKKGCTEAGLKSLQASYKKIKRDNAPMKYSFVADEQKEIYQQDKNLAVICLLFTLAGLVITATGLFTTVYFDTQRRIREIGIRKANGAGTFDLIYLLNKDVLGSFAVAFIVACPLSGWAMDRWLQQFANHITLGVPVFLFAGLLTLLVVLVTAIGQTWWAATRNPTDCMRYE